MKKIILGIILILLSKIIFAMEESNENQFNILPELAKHHPELLARVEELQMNVIEDTIKFELRSESDPLKAVIKAYRYINAITTINKSWYLKKPRLINKLKDWAKELFALDYADFDQKELNKQLGNNMNYLIKRAIKIDIESEDMRKKIIEKLGKEYKGVRKEIFEDFIRDKIVRLIIAGADSNFELGERTSMGLLELMVELEDVDLVLLLIIYGADINHKVLGLSPLAIAIQGNYPHSNMHKVEKIIELLIMHGANINERDKWGLENIALKRISKGKSKQAILLEILLNNGLKLNESDLANIKYSYKLSLPYDDIVNVLEKYGYQI